MGELSKNIEGIGPSRESKLAAAGVNSLDDLRVMNLSGMSSETGIPASRLRTWQQMALLLVIPGIDKQYAEGLVKSSIPDTYALANVDTDIIIQALNDRVQEGLIPHSATEFQVLDWQRYARQIEGGQLEGRKRLATEVSVVWEAMGCRAARNYYEKMDHSCRWFHQFGPFHAYDVTAEDSLKTPEGYLHAFYVGRRYQIPELLSGCRKAPIMSIGLNPNLRGATDDRRICHLRLKMDPPIAYLWTHPLLINPLLSRVGEIDSEAETGPKSLVAGGNFLAL